MESKRKRGRPRKPALQEADPVTNRPVGSPGSEPGQRTTSLFNCPTCGLTIEAKILVDRFGPILELYSIEKKKIEANNTDP